MDKNDTIIDITKKLEKNKASAPDNTSMPKFHTNPIFKKLFVINSKVTEHKFSIKDLFN